MAQSRARSAESTRSDLLAAARARFAAAGYDGTTLRDVAADVGVDPALVIRYFGSKRGLFDAAAELDLRLPDLRGVDPDRLGEVLLPHFFSVWEDRSNFLALLRASTTDEAARTAMLRLFADQVLPALSAAAADRVEERAALMGALVLGLAYSRNVLGTPALTGLDHDALIAALSPIAAAILTGPLPPAGPREP